MRRNRRDRKPPAWFGPIFFIAGVVVMFFGVKILINAHASVNWPFVPGIVTHSDIARHSGDNGNTYGADVAYDYTLEGTRYSANKVSFGQVSSSNISLARKIVNHYPKGKEVQVYYNPEDLEVAVLEPGASWSSYMVLLIGAVFMVVGGAVTMASIIAKEKAGSKDFNQPKIY